MLKLYFSPNSCALASHIALIDAGAAHEAIFVSFKNDEQRKPDYLAINPKARVPSLVTEAGILTETPAILAFIAQTYPQAKLAPADPFAFAQAQAFNSYICSSVHVAHAHRMRGYRWADDESSFADMQRKVPQTVGDCFSLIERTMFKGPWVLGESYSICDPYLFTVAQWMEADGVDPAKFPKVADHRRRMSERGSVRQALDIELGQQPRSAVGA
jgi:glutathione S-transferase